MDIGAQTARINYTKPVLARLSEKSQVELSRIDKKKSVLCHLKLVFQKKTIKIPIDTETYFHVQ